MKTINCFAICVKKQRKSNVFFSYYFSNLHNKDKTMKQKSFKSLLLGFITLLVLSGCGSSSSDSSTTDPEQTDPISNIPSNSLQSINAYNLAGYTVTAKKPDDGSGLTIFNMQQQTFIFTANNNVSIVTDYLDNTQTTENVTYEVGTTLGGTTPTLTILYPPIDGAAHEGLIYLNEDFEIVIEETNMMGYFASTIAENSI